MHAYATNISGKHRLAFWLALISAGVAAGAGGLLSLIAGWIGITAGSVSSMGVFGLSWWWLDNHLWKHPWARRFLLVPDLNGTWKCEAQTTLKGSEHVAWPWDATITITQSWSKLLVRLERGQSGSKSLAASLYHEGDRYRLIYHYQNDPKASEHELKKHTGLTDLLFDKAVNAADGRYFTDGDRLTVGEMKLTRIGDEHERTAEA